jgi:hypothetical protein
MQEYIFIFYYLFLLLGIAIGYSKYKRMDAAIRLLVQWLTIIAIAELATYILKKMENHGQKYVVFHLSSTLEIVLITAYFIKLLRPKNSNILMTLNIVIWPSIALLNALFLQPITELNTNMLMLESFSIITMSLYFIYKVIINNLVENIFQNPHFWISLLWLLLWSTTFFFWALIKILYRAHWRYTESVLTLQGIINLVVYAGITVVILFYSKKNIAFEHS